MKIGGRTPGINRGGIVFHRPGLEPFRLVVRAVPYGFPERLAAELPLPEPPVEYAKDRGGAVLRDRNGDPVRTEKTGDRKYRAELGRVRALRLNLRARESLRGDPAVAFETEDPKPGAWRDSATKVEAEFRAAGFSDAEIVAIYEKSLELESGAPQRIDEASKSFLPPAAESAEPDGSSQSSTAKTSDT